MANEETLVNLIDLKTRDGCKKRRYVISLAWQRRSFFFSFFESRGTYGLLKGLNIRVHRCSLRGGTIRRAIE